jgi:type I restriction-modification system DNA methylase subunit
MPNTENENRLIVMERLRALGLQDLRTDVSAIAAGRHMQADIVAYASDKATPILLAEVKRSLASDLTPLDSPVQQAFSNAAALGQTVRILLVSDGEQYFWYDRGATGDSLVQLLSPPNFREYLERHGATVASLAVLNVPLFRELVGQLAEILRRGKLTFGLQMAIEVNKLLVAKLRDEEVTELGGPRRFVTSENGLETARQLAILFDEAVQSLGPASIAFSDWASPPEVMQEAAEALQQWNLGSLPRDTVRFVFWQNFLRVLRDADSNHTTPLWVANLLVAMAAPVCGDAIVDPTTGSGLIPLLVHARLLNCPDPAQAHLNLLGVELNTEVCELAATNFLLNRVPLARLERRDILGMTADLQARGESFNAAIFDPPVGVVLDHQRRSEFPSSAARIEFALIESMSRLLKPGGRLAMTIPDTCLSSPKFQSARESVLSAFSIQAIIGLPNDAFADAGHSGKASLLLLRRTPSDSEQEPVRLAVLSSSEVQEARSDTDLMFLERVRKALTSTPFESDSNRSPPTSIRTWTRARFEVTAENWTTSFLDPEGGSILALLRAGPYPLEELGNLVEIISGQNFKSYVAQEHSSALLVQAGAVRDLDLNLGDCPGISQDDYAKVSSRSQIRAGDVLVTSTGAYLGRAAVVLQFDRPMVASGAVTVLRPRSGIDPLYLAAYLSSPLGREQIAALQASTTAQPYIRRSDLRRLVLAVPPGSEQREIGQRVELLRSEARRLAVEASALEAESINLVVKALIRS